MIVIKTDIRRKLKRIAAAAAAFIVFSAGVAASFTVFSGALSGTVTAEYSEESTLFAERNIVNGSDLVLYIAKKPYANEDEETGAPVPDKRDESDPVTADSSYEKYLLTMNRDHVTEDLSQFSQHSGKIVEKTFVKAGGIQMIDLAKGGQLRNCTEISRGEVLTECSRASDIAVEMYSDEPQVLIIHTHTSESYEPYEKDWYDDRYTCRSSDPANSVVAVGDAIARELAGAGISVIHDCTIHDALYNGAYTRSLATASDLLERYPSVKTVLDIHRDAIEDEDGTRISAVTEIGGKKAAQIMIICAADDGNYDIPFFMDNLHFACELQQETESMFPTLTRPVLFQYCQYNQQISTGALLIEVGSHGNSADQAIYTGELIGRALSSLFRRKAAEKDAASVPVNGKLPLYFLDRLM